MTPDFSSHYAGLATGPLLEQQMSYQLYRNERVRQHKRSAHHVEVLSRGKETPIIEVRDGGNRQRRHAFGTSMFASLLRSAPEALRDVRVALARVGDEEPRERVELLRLGFMLARTSRQLELGRAILLGDALPPPSAQLTASSSLRVRFAAMNFYNLFETDAKLRQSNNVKFFEAVGPRAARAQAAGHAVHQAKLDYQARGKANGRPPFPVAYTNLSTGRRPFIVPVAPAVTK